MRGWKQNTDRRYLRMGWQATCNMTMDGSRSLRALIAEMYTVRMSDVCTPAVGGQDHIKIQKQKDFQEMTLCSTLIHDIY